MPETSKSVVTQEATSTDPITPELLDWDFVISAPPPKRSGKVTCKTNYRGRSQPLAIESD